VFGLQPGNGEGLFWFRRFINLSLTYLDNYPLTYSSGTHMERLEMEQAYAGKGR